MKLLHYISSPCSSAFATSAVAASLCLFLNFPFDDCTARAQDTVCGILWHEPVVLANEHGLPSITAQGNTVHVTWFGGTIKLPYIRSTNEGAQWDTLRDLLPNYGLVPWRQIVKSNNNTVYIFWIEDDSMGKTWSRFIKSNTNGNEWGASKRITNHSIGFHTADLKNDTIIIPIDFNYLPGYSWPFMMSSTDAGASWRVAPDTLWNFVEPALSEGTLHIVLRDKFMLETDYWKSYDLGFTWAQKMPLSAVDNRGSTYGIIAARNNRVIAAWRDTKYGCNNSFSCSIVIRNSDSGGDEWFDEENITGGYFGIPRDITIKENTVAVVWEHFPGAGDGEGCRVRVSFDEGATWCPVFPVGVYGTGDPVVAITEHAIHVVYSNYGTSQVLYRRGEIINTAVAEPPAGISSCIALEQNYPNPFNPTTTIRFEIPLRPPFAKGETGGLVTLKIYDIYGKETATLINHKEYAAGKYTVEWNAEKYAGGMYFYRLSVTSHNNVTSVITKKMIVLK
jgi:hypothetical protein